MLRQRSCTLPPMLAVLALALALAAGACSGGSNDNGNGNGNNNGNDNGNGNDNTVTYPPLTSSAMQLADLGVAVPATATRPFIFTDGGSTYLYGEAAGAPGAADQGVAFRAQSTWKMIDEWQWNGQTPAAFADATVYPDHAERSYADGTTERITLLDSASLGGGHTAAVLVEPAGTGALTFRPLMNDSRDPTAYSVTATGGALAIARARDVATPPTDRPMWLVIKAAGATATVDGVTVLWGGLKPKLFAAGKLDLPAATPVVIAAADTAELATALADDVLAHAAAYKAARQSRMQALLDQAYVKTADADFNKAYAWIRLSADALVMNVGALGKGLFAGLTYFPEYWGRDSFITLTGSHLVTGKWEEARAILRSYAALQYGSPGKPGLKTDLEPNTHQPIYGRIPNKADPTGVAYNTADGTPWFVIDAYEYLLRSGDTAFAAEIWSTVALATDSDIELRTDANGFLKHGDQETWMDANGCPTKPCTPRGDRAVEIQGLWYRQLLASAAIADLAGDTSGKAATYRAKADYVLFKFKSAFQDAASGMLVDHIAADGAKNLQVRPNQFIALRALADVLDATKVATATRRAAALVAYQHGVASLAQSDPQFHPYHIFPGYYEKDEAYHQGVVWDWLSGPLVSLMVDQHMGEKAYDQLVSHGDVALHRGVVGALSELEDALPRPVPGSDPLVMGDGAPQLANAVFQAWSLGEHVRNVHEDFAGVRYLAADHVALTPRLPTAWGATRTRFRVGAEGYVTAVLTPGAGTLDVELTAEGTLPKTATVTVTALGTSQDATFEAAASSTLHFTGTEAAPHAVWSGFDWLQFNLDPTLACFTGQPYAILDLDVIKAAPGGDYQTVLDLSDAQDDDTGPAGASYTYPTDSHFAPGMFDLTHLTLGEDSGAYYFVVTFRNLVNPEWHPEAGYQLTYTAIALDTDGAAGTGQTAVQHVASYTLPGGKGYEYALYVGNGFEVVDGAGTVLAKYQPYATDVLNPLGDADAKTVSFRVPKSVLPHLPTGTIVTVLTGSQDDYGTGVMGDFRTVNTGAADGWHGGGKLAAGDTNAYDTATATLP